MTRMIRTATAMAAFGVLAACQSLPSVPTSIFSGNDLAPCPQLATGSAPYAPPFPAECEQMNKTASGVRYIPLVNGDQANGSPDMASTIVVNYEAFLETDGTRIDSSYARGESSVLAMTELIDGWAEAVQLMNPGDEWLILVPSEEAFGSEPLGDLIPANSDLVYRVKLDGFLTAEQLAAVSGGASEAPAEPAQPAQAAELSGGIEEPLGPDMGAWQAYFPWDASKPGVNTLPSGLSYVTLERGNSTVRNAILSDNVLIHYEGRLAETSEFFDSSWSRGEPTVFPVGGVVPGFSEALTFMRPGDRLLVHIPSELAYGADGAGDAVPPNADLMFQINLLEIQPAE